MAWSVLRIRIGLQFTIKCGRGSPPCYTVRALEASEHLCTDMITQFPEYTRPFLRLLETEQRLNYLQFVQEASTHAAVYFTKLYVDQILGEIPNWIWKLGYLSYVNLSCNSFVTLEAPLVCSSDLIVIDLHSNQLQGKFSIFFPIDTYLNYPRNNFSSSIPNEIGNSLIRLCSSLYQAITCMGPFQFQYAMLQFFGFLICLIILRVA
ncbi:receptor-like protein 53 isoform X2 [Pyrus x bretschneideri]|uniref:receptor-like protein 53 isoform X2 n=1 Tax=Pyrus x bretschneideri TaxID=225117 RepID=UPI00202DD8F4|nr:receptor-like protein 53 isoform X2 [Pyrus x bretschneideri]